MKTQKKETRSKKKEMLPAVVKPKRISKLKRDQVESIFGDSSEKILQMLETGDQDTAVSLIYKKALSTVVDLLPLAENAVRKSEGARGIYQLNQLISSTRELLVDIQSAQDRGMLGHALVDKIIRPAYSDIASEIVREYSTVAADAKALIPEKDWAEFQAALRESRSRLADTITKQYRQVRDNTCSYLQR